MNELRDAETADARDWLSDETNRDGREREKPTENHRPASHREEEEKDEEEDKKEVLLCDLE